MLAKLQTQLIELIHESISELIENPSDIPELSLEIPKEKKHGELSCTVALRLAAILKRDPFSIAGDISKIIEKRVSKSSLKDKIEKVDIKRPGFINFFLSVSAFYDVLSQILGEKDDYGISQKGEGKKIQVEFVSANPTGPLSVAHARQAAVGDALANILTNCGWDVTKEYYVNDEGNQIALLGKSIECRLREVFGEKTELPDQGYQGEYIKDIAELFAKKYEIKDMKALDSAIGKDPDVIEQFGVDYLLDVIKNELKDFGVEFDVWAHQSEIATPKKISSLLTDLRKKDFVYEKDGAFWFKSTAFGDDKDRVVKKSDGSFTYLSPDFVYHQDKYSRGFEHIINIWGPDHHGYIPRLKAAVQAMGHHEESLSVKIVQLATIFRNKQPLSMSTRKGQYISLREVMDEVGVDAARFFFLMRRMEAHLDFDLELAKKETPENPVYYIQYAHARIHSIMDFAKQSKVKMNADTFDLIKEEEELDLIKKLGSFPDMLLVCERQLDPFALSSYLIELAIVFHKFYDKNRVVGEDLKLSAQRLGLVEATRIVLNNGLTLLGISAPKKM